MAVHFWEATVENSRTGPGLTEIQRSDFENSPYSLVCADPLMSYPLPPYQKPAGEPFSLDIQGVVRLVAPIVIGKEVDVAGALFWHIIPGILIFDMTDFSAPLETIEISPEEPSLEGGYCDASVSGLSYERFIGGTFGSFAGLFNGPYPYAGATNGLIGSTRPPIASCAWAEGTFIGFVRVGDWLVSQCQAGNQLWAYNFETEAMWHEAGWDQRPPQIARIASDADPLNPITAPGSGEAVGSGDDGILSFGDTLEHTNTTFEVLGKLSPTTALVLRTEADLTSFINSSFNLYRLEPFSISSNGSNVVTVSHNFTGKWINDTSNGATAIDGSLSYYSPYTWNGAPFLQCGGLSGYPWTSAISSWTIAGGFANPQDRVLYSIGFALSKMTADLDETISVPEWKGLKNKGAKYFFEEWEFPDTGSPSFLRTVLDFDESRVYQGEAIIQGPSEYTITDPISYGGMNLIEAPEEWFSELPYYLVGPPSGVDLSLYEYSPYSGFQRGAGVAVYEYQFIEGDEFSYPGENYWRLWSEDTNVCPGPGGPWIVGESDWSQPDDDPLVQKLLLRVVAPIVAWQQIPKLPKFDSSNYVANADGSVIVFLPRGNLGQSQSMPYLNFAYEESDIDAELKLVQTITCLKLDGGTWTQAFSLKSNDLVDPIIFTYFSTERMSMESGSCVSNGILTESFLFCVLYGNEGEQLFQICVNNYEDYVPGDVVAVVNISGGRTFAHSSASWLYDSILIANRRIVGTANDTHFWTLELESDAGSGS